MEEKQGDALASMLEKIVADPSFASLVGELRGGAAPASEALGAEMREKLPSVLSMVAPMLGGAPSAPPQTETAPPLASSAPVVTQGIGGKYDKVRAEKLLAAIKPYLSASRCAMIDQCVSVLQLGDVMTALQGIVGRQGEGGS